MNLYIDDIRTPVDFENWIIARNADQAITELKLALSNGEIINHISYDHDMGEDTIRTVLNWQAFHDVAPLKASIHTSNPVGKKWIEEALEHDFDSVINIVPSPEFVA